LIASTECRPHAISRFGWFDFDHGSTCMMEPQAVSVLSCSACSRLGAHISVRLLTARAHHTKPSGIPKETTASRMPGPRSIATICTLSSLVKDHSARRLPEGGSKCGGARIATSKILSMPLTAWMGKILSSASIRA